MINFTWQLSLLHRTKQKVNENVKLKNKLTVMIIMNPSIHFSIGLIVFSSADVHHHNCGVL